MAKKKQQFLFLLQEADEALLHNLELQIELQFLQDDLNVTKDRYKKNLMEIQTYVSILQQVVQTIPRVSTLATGVSEERLISERRIPILQGQLEEYKSVLCQLQAQKMKLQTEIHCSSSSFTLIAKKYLGVVRAMEIFPVRGFCATLDSGVLEHSLELQSLFLGSRDSYWGMKEYYQLLSAAALSKTTMLEQAIKSTQESYEDEIQLYNEQIDTLRKSIEDAERTLEKYTNDCRQLSIYKQSLENELERYKRIIENEDSRLNSAIVGTPVTPFIPTYRPSQAPVLRGRDITLVIQGIASAKLRQRSLSRKISRRKEITPKDLTNGGPLEKMYDRPREGFDHDHQDFKHEGLILTGEHGHDVDVEEEAEQERAVEDVPDGAQISKAFDKLCNIVRERIKCYQRPEAKSEFYSKGRYVLVTGEGSYEEPSFRSSSIPSVGEITVSDSKEEMLSENGVEPIPELPEPVDHDKNKLEAYETPERPKIQEDMKQESRPESKEKEDVAKELEKPEEKDEESTREPSIEEIEPVPTAGVSERNEAGVYVSKEYESPPSIMSYEKVEVMESIEKFSDDKMQTYEETAMIVETMIEKTSKKKVEDKSS
ncbi:hypothetical protein JD844_023526 [Phrynosoma platyrhinos]|uniref:Beaded filament structural protein 1 n=1 Tax=Phrynosoma platyrhinos TaxID=52577 RepID=A0ABQ7SWP0_PHRPL|nr:hypothetical protein JD844_023526 [Phrynosoma platyrhinos]